MISSVIEVAAYSLTGIVNAKFSPFKVGVLLQAATLLVLLGKLADMFVLGAPGTPNIQMIGYFTVIFFQGLAISSFFVI